MGQIRVDAESFNLNSTYKCQQTVYDYYLDGVHKQQVSGASACTESSTVQTTIRFDYDLPEGATVTDAKVYATLGSPLNSAHTSKINGISVGTADTVSVDVELTEGESFVEIPFVFKCRTVYHEISTHSNATVASRERKKAYKDGVEYDLEIVTLSAQHTSSLAYDDVYLLIDYEGGDDTGEGEGGGDTGGGDTGDTGSTGAIESDTVKADGFKLSSYFTYTLTERYYFSAAGSLVDTESEEYYMDASTGAETVRFDLGLPEGAVVTSATVHATLGSGKYRKDVLTIAGQPVSYGQNAVVPVSVPEDATYVDVRFAYKCDERSFDPDAYSGWVTQDWWDYDVASANNCDVHTFMDKANCQSVVEVSDVYLVVEYTLPGATWRIVDDVVRPDETLEVVLDLVTAGRTYTTQASIGGYSSGEVSVPTDTATVNIPVQWDWLYAIPDSVTGTGAVVVREYLDGVLKNETALPFTLTCPVSVIPTIEGIECTPLLTVDGVTYPDVLSGKYVQNKCGIYAKATGVSAPYGATIVSGTIYLMGYEGESYTASGTELKSGLLYKAGGGLVVCSVTDSRGRSVEYPEVINVQKYSPPAGEIRVWRVNDEGEKDEHGAHAAYEYTATHTSLSGANPLSVALTADGVTVTNPPSAGLLFPGKTHTFDGSTVYSVELVLTDAYDAVTVTAPILPSTGTTVVIRPTRKQKRRLIIGDYDTVTEGDWTLTALEFIEPDYQSNFVSVPGRQSGSLDMSTVLTNGIPTYESRELSARFECSGGTRQERNDIISRMVNELDGRRWQITLPDDPDRYVVGRVSVKKEYSDMAHAAVVLSAVCEPWRYNKLETEIAYAASTVEAEGVLPNTGRRVLIPTVRVTGSVTLTCAGKVWTLTEGEYRLPELILPPGNTPITFSGDGFISFVYREAVL